MPDILLLDYDETQSCFGDQANARLEQIFIRAALIEKIKTLNVIAIYGITARSLNLLRNHMLGLEALVKRSNTIRATLGKPPRNPCDLLTIRLTENFLKETKLEDKFVTVSMRGDKGRECGAEYKEVAACETMLIESYNKHGRFIIPEFKRGEVSEFAADTSKNSQIDHIIETAEAKFGKGHTFHYFDDVGRLCALAAHRYYPNPIDLRVYHVKHTEITPIPSMVFFHSPPLQSHDDMKETIPPAIYDEMFIQGFLKKLVAGYHIDAENMQAISTWVSHFLIDNRISGLSEEFIAPLIQYEKSSCCCFFRKKVELQVSQESVFAFENFIESQLLRILNNAKVLPTPSSSSTSSHAHHAIREESISPDKENMIGFDSSQPPLEGTENLMAPLLRKR